MFTGCGTALVTPFKADGALDEASTRQLVRRQIAEGIDFLVPCGTTGESPTLTHEEHLRVVAITVEEARGKVPVLAGAGGYNTREVAHLAKECEKLGADGVLSVTPYYNKPTPEGLYQHYKAIADAINIPIMLYNIAGRTGLNIDPTTMLKLAEIDKIIGVKEASGSISQMAEIVHRLPHRFIMLSGDDAITIPLIAVGGHGIISVVSNQIPGEMSDLARLANAGDFEGARRIQQKFFALMQVNFIEANPGPVKWGMYKMGLIEPNYRLPMVPPTPVSQKKIEAVLEEVGLADSN
ncbi:MAG: dihydrodipicolinate synthase [Bryobacterales bacterium]|nr:dihydrodipicolinate synthase [Bryobacterales bacterium]